MTDWVCDCEFPFGAGDPSADDLAALAKHITAVQSANNSKCIYLCKTWEGRINKTEAAVSLNSIDIYDFLANAKENCLYTINLH